MASMGFQPSLAAVTDVGSEGVIHSFVSGLRVAYRIMAGVMVISMVLSFIRGGGSASATTSDNDSPEPLPAKQS